MKKVIIIIAFMSFFGIMSCSKFIEPQDESKVPAKVVTIHCEASFSPSTRVVLGSRNDSEQEMLWQGDENIWVYYSEGSSIVKAQATEIEVKDEGKYLSFNVNITAPSGSGPWTLYSVAGNVLGDNIVLPVSQNPSATSFDPSTVLLKAIKENITIFPSEMKFTYDHLCAYGYMSIAGIDENIDKVSLQSSVSQLSGDTYLAQENITGGGTILEVDCANLLSGKNVFFACLPVTFNSDNTLRIAVYTASGKIYSKALNTSERPLSFSSGRIKAFKVDFSTVKPAYVSKRIYEFDVADIDSYATIYNQSAELLAAEVNGESLDLNVNESHDYMKQEGVYSRSKLILRVNKYPNGAHLKLTYGGVGTDARMVVSNATASNLVYIDESYEYAHESFMLQPDFLLGWDRNNGNEPYLTAIKGLGWEYISINIPDVVESLSVPDNSTSLNDAINMLRANLGDLKIMSIHLPYEISKNGTKTQFELSSTNKDIRKSSVDELKEFINHLKILNPVNMLVHCNGLLSYENVSVESLTQSLVELQTYAGDIQIVVENMSAGLGSSYVHLVEAVNNANEQLTGTKVGIAVDTGHIHNYITSPDNTTGETLASWVSRCGSLVKMVHISGNRGWNDEGSDVWTRVRDDHCYPLASVFVDNSSGVEKIYEDTITPEEWKDFYLALMQNCGYDKTFCYETQTREHKYGNIRTYAANVHSPWQIAHHYYSKMVPLMVNAPVNGIDPIDWQEIETIF